VLIGIAAALGGLVGLEREWSGKPAGLRTHMLVAAAACLFMILGHATLDAFSDEQFAGTLGADPIRIMQAIVVGISFLGAGTIIEGAHRRVEGLTTAASVLLVSGIGIAVAIGQVLLAGCVTVLALVTLVALGLAERRWGKDHADGSDGDGRPPSI